MELLDNRSLCVLNQPITEDNFEDSENELAELCKEFFDKWEYKVQGLGLPPLGNEALQNFVTDTKYVFQYVYKVYGCPSLIEEMDRELNEEDQDVAKEVAEHKQFLENIKYVIDCNEISEFENDLSKVCISLKESNNYLKQKQKEQQELLFTMKELNAKIQTAGKMLECYLEQNQ